MAEHTMHYRHALLVTLAFAASACSDEPTAPVVPGQAVQLRDIVIPTLPSPYYHFEYDTAGRIRVVSFASGLITYEVTYDGDRIREMHSVPGRDTLNYFYDAAGRVTAVNYVRSEGVVSARFDLGYEGQQLVRLERAVRVDAGLIIDKTLSLTYHSDGNLLEMVVHRPQVDGLQNETTSVERFELYDAGINVDGFDLVHDDFLDPPFLLPGVRLQKGNPGREARTGDGANFLVDYVYTYDDANRPLTKIGAVTFLSEPYVGQRFQTRSEFSYY